MKGTSCKTVVLSFAIALPALWSARVQAQGSVDTPRDQTTPSTGIDSPQPAATSSGTKSEPQCEETGRIITFKAAATSLSPAAKQALDKAATWVKEAPGRSLRLDGSSDKKGSTERNQELSQERADNAKAYLAQKGVDEASITTEALGETTERPRLVNLRAVEIRECSTPVAEAPAEPPAPPMAALPPEPAPPPAPAPAPQTYVMPQPAAPVVAPVVDHRPPSRVGIAMGFGGGVTGFSDKETRAFTDPGGSWEARAAFGTRMPVAFEAAYVGSAQNLQALGLESDALLVGNGAEGTVRFNVGAYRVQPYVFGGAGWTRYSVARAPIANSSLSSDRDDVWMVPTGAGLSFRVGRALLLDLRGTYRFAFEAELFNGPYASTGKTAGLSNWNAAGHLGWEF